MMPWTLRRGAARLALIVWFASAALPLAQAHGTLNEDAACGWLIAPDGRAAALGQAASAATHDHCAICHLQRAYGRATTAANTASPTLVRTTTPSIGEQGSARRLVLRLLPPRAPPASPAPAV